METVHMIAGLGNPGEAYVRTRHNAGFMVVDRLAARWGLGWDRSRRFRARLARGQWGARPVLLCQPQTFMNASGEAVAGLVGYYRVALERLLVVVDDADLDLGTIRLRPGGSSGGHHGLESVEGHLGTRQYARMRLGVGRDRPERREITDYVLSEFGAAEEELWDRVRERACDQAECWCLEGVGQAMNRFNGVITT